MASVNYSTTEHVSLPSNAYSIGGSYARTGQSLESVLQENILQRIDARRKINFLNYINPNEGNPIGIKRHIDLITAPGVFVSAGSERSFFDLVFCPPDQCQGLIIIDINPRIKAYSDFNTMLLRISKNRMEYEQLSADLLFTDKETFENRLSEIKQILKESEISEPMKSYYLENLDDFGNIYFLSGKKEWRNSPDFADVQYQTDDRLFHILQKYAREGNIIATVGDINDLRFLNGLNIALIDVSNIPDYIFLNFQAEENFHPRIIWTDQDPKNTKYYSCEHETASEQTKQKIDQLVIELRDARVLPQIPRTKKIQKPLLRKFLLPDHVELYSEARLKQFEQLKLQWSAYSEM